MQKNWYWIELIGFDCDEKDFGVGHFFEVTSGNIEGITFLFSNIDFVNLHDGITGKALQPCDCSYGATLYSEERKRQPWTDVQLKGLKMVVAHNYFLISIYIQKCLYSFRAALGGC